MRAVIAALLVICLAVMAKADGPTLAPIPNLQAAVGYDFALDGLVAGATSQIMSWDLVSLQVGYITSDKRSAWIGGAGVDVARLAKLLHASYLWGAVKTNLSGYGGYNFNDKSAVYGVLATVVQF